MHRAYNLENRNMEQLKFVFLLLLGTVICVLLGEFSICSIISVFPRKISNINGFTFVLLWTEVIENIDLVDILWHLEGTPLVYIGNITVAFTLLTVVS